VKEKLFFILNYDAFIYLYFFFDVINQNDYGTFFIVEFLVTKIENSTTITVLDLFQKKSNTTT
jgi:hypothetical protein